MKSAIAIGLIGVGILLLVLCSLWVKMFPGTSAWTAEKSEQWSEVKDRLHNLAYVVNNPSGRVNMHSGRDRGDARAEFDKLKKESDQYAAEFQSAHDRPRTAAAVLKWVGIASAGLGIVGWLILKDS